jgi:hypothetical protein
MIMPLKRLWARMLSIFTAQFPLILRLVAIAVTLIQNGKRWALLRMALKAGKIQVSVPQNSGFCSWATRRREARSPASRTAQGDPGNAAGPPGPGQIRATWAPPSGRDGRT